MYIDLPEEVQEFAYYDADIRTIFIDEKDLRPEHEGSHTLEVQIGYGYGDFEQRFSVDMQLIVILPDTEEEPVV